MWQRKVSGTIPVGRESFQCFLFSCQMTIEEVLRAFAEENFDENDYHPVSHGERSSIRPLALVVKKPRPVFKRPFAKTEFTVLALLEDYVLKDKKEEFIEVMSSTIVKEENLEIEEDDSQDDGAKRYPCFFNFTASNDTNSPGWIFI